jgi:hypothetical protein
VFFNTEVFEVSDADRFKEVLMAPTCGSSGT